MLHPDVAIRPLYFGLHRLSQALGFLASTRPCDIVSVEFSPLPAGMTGCLFRNNPHGNPLGDAEARDTR